MIDMLNKEQIDAVIAAVKAEASQEVQKINTRFEELKKDATKGLVDENRLDAVKSEMAAAYDRLEEVAKKQGTTIAELKDALENGGGANSAKSIAEVFEDNKAALMDIKSAGAGFKEFALTRSDKGGYSMEEVKTVNGQKVATKAPIATIAGVGGAGNAASVSQALTAAGLLRIGEVPVVENYANNNWLLDLATVTRTSLSQSRAVWLEEEARVGDPAVVAEGATKPSVQYKYKYVNNDWKKAAALITFTQEFDIDFGWLEDRIIASGRRDVMAVVNSTALSDVTTAATMYNTATEFKGGVPVPSANEFDVIAAMAAQVDNSTYGNGVASAAIMSAFKKYRMGVLKDTTTDYLNAPDVISGIKFIGNPGMGNDDVIVGDISKLNILLRGGFIVRVGYNGTDFAQNQFSVVLEQFFQSYVAAPFRPAIVKGTFSTIKTAIGA